MCEVFCRLSDSKHDTTTMTKKVRNDVDHTHNSPIYYKLTGLNQSCHN